MQGTNYGDGVLVTQTDLNRTESSKAEEIQRSRVDFSTRGMLSGGETTVNLVNDDRLDVQAFTGYTPRGDYIVGDLATNNLPLEDNTSGVVNVICGVYSEVNTGSKTTEAGVTSASKKEGSYRVVVFTQADFDNPLVLPISDDNLANDARDRCLILSKVTGTGGTLTASNITSPTVYESTLYANPTEIPSMAGIDIISVDPATDTGLGLLEYQYVAPNYQVRWTAPNGVVGSWKSWTEDGTQEVFDGSATPKSLSIYMAISQMDTSGTFPYTANITIVDLYGQEVPRETSEDHLHRSKKGTGIISEQNPHGLSLDDVSGETISLLDEHQDVMHCNGIWKGSASSVLSTAIVSTVGDDSVNITAPLSTDIFYINGKRTGSIDRSIIPFDFLTKTSHLVELYITDEGEVKTNLKASYPALPRELQGTWIIAMSENFPSGSVDLSVDVSGTPGTLVYKFGLDTLSGEGYTLNQGEIDQAIRLFTPDGNHWIDLWVRCSTTGSSDAFLPGTIGTHIDVITINASPEWQTNMPIAQVPYWYATSLATDGEAGYPPYAGGRSTVDSRIWGNTCEDNLTDKALQELFYHPEKEQGSSGVVLFRDRHEDSSTNFDLTSDVASLDITISGGHVYLRGQRVSITGNLGLTLPGSKTSLVYADLQGTLQYLNVTDNYSGDEVLAMQYLLGDGSYRENLQDGYSATMQNSTIEIGPERGVPLYLLTTDGSGVDQSTVQPIYRNVNTNLGSWSVGKTALGPLGSFVNLRAAFLHAKVLPDSLKDFLLVGVSTEAHSGALESPDSLSIRGLSSDAEILFTGSGTWYIPENTRLSGLTVNSTTINIKLRSGLVMRDCSVNSTSAVGIFVSLGDPSITEINDVTLSNTYFGIRGLSPAADYSAVTFSNWKIQGCTFVGQSLPGEAFIQMPLRNSTIEGNTFTTDNGLGGSTNYAISLEQVSKVHILNNIVEIGEGDTTFDEVGIKLDGGVNIKVESNFIAGLNAIPSRTTGLLLSGSLERTTIASNNLQDLSRGLVGEASTVLTDVNILSNIIRQLTCAGIYLDDCRGLGVIIKSNTVSEVNLPATDLLNLGIFGIRWSSGDRVEDILISSNIITDIQDAETLDSFNNTTGISASFSAGGTLVSIVDNELRDIRSTQNVQNSTVRGIQLLFGLTSTEETANVSRNSLTTVRSDVASFTIMSLNITGASTLRNFTCEDNILQTFVPSTHTASATGLSCFTSTTTQITTSSISNNKVTLTVSSSAATTCKLLSITNLVGQVYVKSNQLNIAGTNSSVGSFGIRYTPSSNVADLSLNIDGNLINMLEGSGTAIEAEFTDVDRSTKLDIRSNRIITGQLGINIELASADLFEETVLIIDNDIDILPSSSNLPSSTRGILFRGCPFITDNRIRVLSEVTSIAGGTSASSTFLVYLTQPFVSGIADPLNLRGTLKRNLLDMHNTEDNLLINGVFVEQSTLNLGSNGVEIELDTASNTFRRCPRRTVSGTDMPVETDSPDYPSVFTLEGRTYPDAGDYPYLSVYFNADLVDGGLGESSATTRPPLVQVPQNTLVPRWFSTGTNRVLSMNNTPKLSGGDSDTW